MSYLGNTGNRAIILDRDGTLNVNTHYLIEFSEFKPMPGAIEGLLKLKDLGYRFFGASNQSGVARGYFTPKQVDDLNQKIQEFFSTQGIEIEEIAYCPHHPEGSIAEFARVCTCRKPKPGMVLDLAGKYGLDLSKSFMVGDQEWDVACGEAAGAKGVLVSPKKRGPESSNRVHLKSFETLLDFAQWISSEGLRPMSEGLNV